MGVTQAEEPGRIFISYRRRETAYPAGWLFDRLADHFGRDQVFKDVDSIQLGDDFVEVITAAVGSCDVLLVLIGDRWLTITDERGRRRLDDPADFVRVEIEAALARNVRVIPILVEGARMPRADELPANLTKLVRRQALELSPSRFDFDIGRLLRVLDRTITEAKGQERVRQEAQQLQAQMRERAAAQDWDAVLAASDQLIALDPAAADLDALASIAREQVTRRQQAERAAAQRQHQIEQEALTARPLRPQPSPRPAVEPSGPQTLALTLRNALEGSIDSAAFSPDGQLLVIAGIGNKIVFWDPANGQQLRSLTPEAKKTWLFWKCEINSVVFSPDGCLLASAAQDKVVRLWDPATGEGQRILTGHTGWIYSVAFSPDGRLLASAGDDKVVRLWDPATGEGQRILTGHTGSIRSVAFSPDGRLLASAGDDKVVRLWDPATGEGQRILTGHTGSIRSVAFSPDGRLLASAGDDKVVRLWDPATGEGQRILTGHTGSIRSVAFSPDGRLLASAGNDKVVRLWDPATGEGQRILTGHTGSICSVAFSPDGRLLASAGADHVVRLWS